MKQLYFPFEGYEKKEFGFKLVGTSKRSVREVALVQTARINLPDDARAKWAEQARMTPVSYNEVKIKDETKKVPVFEIEDIYNEGTIHAAMAQVMFEGFPQIINPVQKEDGSWEVEIIDQEMFEALEEGVVNSAFFDWNMSRAGQSLSSMKSLAAAQQGQSISR